MKHPAQDIRAALERWALRTSEEMIGKQARAGQEYHVASFAIVGVGVVVWTSADPLVFTLARPAEVTISINRLDWFCAAAVIEQARHLSRQPLKRLNQ